MHISLLRVDKEPWSEWDTLNLFVSSLSKRAFALDLAASVRFQKHVKTLRIAQGDFKKNDEAEPCDEAGIEMRQWYFGG